MFKPIENFYEFPHILKNKNKQTNKTPPNPCWKPQLCQEFSPFLFHLDFSGGTSFLEIRMLLPLSIGRACSPGGTRTCLGRRTESPSCACRFSNSFSLKYAVCQLPYVGVACSDLRYYKANMLSTLGTLASFSKKQASAVLMLKQLE